MYTFLLSVLFDSGEQVTVIPGTDLTYFFFLSCTSDFIKGTYILGFCYTTAKAIKIYFWFSFKVALGPSAFSKSLAGLFQRANL